MKFKYFFLLGLSTGLILNACSVDEPMMNDSSDVIQYANVDKALWPFFKSFEKEGAKRGLTIDLNSANITASFKDIEEENVAGTCSYSHHSPRKITIDIPFWKGSTHLAKEMIVFHELGHCYLGRGHLETKFESGYCRSIMRSGTCCCRDAYNEQNRNYYLDELYSKGEDL